MRRILRLVAATTLIGLCWAGTGVATGAPSTDVPGAGSSPVAIEPVPAVTLPPELDPFYTPPAGAVAGAQPGEILKARAINPGFFGLLPLNVDAWQLLYRSNDSHGQAISSVTTVLKPRGKAPTGGRKLLSYQIAEDSAAQYCAPSYVAQLGALPVDTINAAEQMIPVAAGIGQGWTVALPDYEGPNSAYGAARLGAQLTLDGIRAVESFTPAQLDGPGTPAAMWGYSGGTIPTSFAAEIKPNYAPELNIVGAASGGVAPADFAGLVRHNNGGVYAGLISGAFVGIATEYPDMQAELDKHVNGLGKFVLASKRVLCHPQGTAVFPGLNYLGTFDGDPLALPAIKHAIADNTLGQVIPTVPVYMYHAQNDEIIPIKGTDDVVGEYCRDGATSVTYVRELLAEHISGIFTSLPGGFTWLRDRLDGVPATPGCTITSPVTNVVNPEFTTVLGQVLPTAAQALIGMAIK